MKNMECLRCGKTMSFMKHEKIQLGQASAWLGQRRNIIAGALDVDIYVCTGCGKLEFFRPGGGFDAAEDIVNTGIPEDEGLPAAVRCPDCGWIGDPRGVEVCPECGCSALQIRCLFCGRTRDFDILPVCPYCGK